MKKRFLLIIEDLKCRYRKYISVLKKFYIKEKLVKLDQYLLHPYQIIHRRKKKNTTHTKTNTKNHPLCETSLTVYSENSKTSGGSPKNHTHVNSFTLYSANLTNLHKYLYTDTAFNVNLFCSTTQCIGK